MSILIKNGRVLDPATATDQVADIYVEKDVIQKIGKGLKEKADQVIDAKGCYVMPGLIDLHVHLRDPGQEYKEDVQTGAQAAAKGGFTTIVAMPNTKPVIDNPDRVRYVHNKAASLAPICVLQAGAITKGQQNEELADIEGMIAAGASAVSEDGKSVMDANLYREAMKVAAKNGIPVLAHCEDATMVNGGCMNADEKAEELGLPGITNSVEDVIVARDILLADETGVHLHLCHCSTKRSVELVRMAKSIGISVSAEVCPHHFTLTSEDIVTDDPNYKMNPPLRTKEDREALRAGLADGTMEVISTDHAPHSAEEKQGSIRKAPFGIVGLETCVPLTVTELVDKELITPLQMAEKMSYNPAKILGIDKGTIQEGRKADITIIDSKASYTIDRNTFISKGKNTPFHGRKVKGKVMTTIFEGRIVYQNRNR